MFLLESKKVLMTCQFGFTQIQIITNSFKGNGCMSYTLANAVDFFLSSISLDTEEN